MAAIGSIVAAGVGILNAVAGAIKTWADSRTSKRIENKLDINTVETVKGNKKVEEVKSDLKVTDAKATVKSRLELVAKGARDTEAAIKRAMAEQDELRAKLQVLQRAQQQQLQQQPQEA